MGRMPAEPHGAAEIGPTPVAGPASSTHGMVGQERREMRLHRHRAHTGTAATVRDAERLVQVEVRHVGAELARFRHADERVEVGAVEVHLAAVVVHDVADLADLGFEHPVGRRVRDHEARQTVGMLGRLAAEVDEIDVAVARRIRRPRRAARPSPRWPRSFRVRKRGSDRRRARARLGRGDSARIASSPANSPCEPAFGCSDTASYPVTSTSICSSSSTKRLVSAVWSGGAKGWSAPNSGHVTGIISAVALSFIVHEPSGIMARSSAMSLSARRRRYRSISVSEWYRWNVGCVRKSDVRRRSAGIASFSGQVQIVDRRLDPECLPDALDDVSGRRLVERDAERVVVDVAQVEAEPARARRELVTLARHSDRQRVEEGVVRDLDTTSLEARREDRRESMHARRDAS